MNPRELPRHLLAEGRYVITLDEAQDLLGLKRRTAVAALSRLRKQGLLFSPTDGVYVLIPHEYESWGVIPADLFIDDLMRYLKRPYYVAFLSAAAIHGAAHQAPQVFQVMTTRQLRPRDIHRRIRLRFYRSTFFASSEIGQITVATGEMQVGTKETTVVDLVANPRAGGGLSNVATVVSEIGGLHGSSLARIAVPRGLAVVRRVGWLTEQFGQVDDLEALRQAARLGDGDASPLAPSAGRSGQVDKRWSLRLNTTVEPDL